MSNQIFCVRQDAAIGLAAIHVDDDGRITLFETHLATGDILDDFSTDLREMVSGFRVSDVLCRH